MYRNTIRRSNYVEVYLSNETHLTTRTSGLNSTRGRQSQLWWPLSALGGRAGCWRSQAKACSVFSDCVACCVACIPAIVGTTIRNLNGLGASGRCPLPSWPTCTAGHRTKAGSAEAIELLDGGNVLCPAGHHAQQGNGQQRRGR